MRLEVADFGPVRKGGIDLAPLTVFVGPNNSGKSVMASLTYAATRPAWGVRRFGRSYFGAPLAYRGRSSRGLRGLGDGSKYAADHAEFLERLIRNPSLPTARFPDSVSDLFRPRLNELLTAYVGEVRTELARAFGARVQDLGRSTGPRTKRRRFDISITHGDPRWRVEVASVRGSPTIHSDEIDIPTLIRRVRRTFKGFFEAEWVATLPPDQFMVELLGLASHLMFSEMPSTSYYLPAARSGFLQSHRAIASSVVSRAPYAGIEDMQIPKMSGVIADFISALLQIPDAPNNQDVDDVASFLERTLEGSIRLEAKPGAYPDIWYEGAAGRLPLHRTSSMVSELAPVVLYMRYLLDPGELLIIEEPESHLHPASQLVFARAIVRLVNTGVRVLLTTHSDYFLSQLNNLIRAAALERSVYEREGIAQEETIGTDRVNAYAFDRRRTGTVVEPVRVTKSEGIPADEFARVAEPLYTETVHLQRRLIEAG